MHYLFCASWELSEEISSFQTPVKRQIRLCIHGEGPWLVFCLLSRWLLPNKWQLHFHVKQLNKRMKTQLATIPNLSHVFFICLLNSRQHPPFVYSYSCPFRTSTCGSLRLLCSCSIPLSPLGSFLLFSKALQVFWLPLSIHPLQSPSHIFLCPNRPQCSWRPLWRNAHVTVLQLPRQFMAKASPEKSDH